MSERVKIWREFNDLRPIPCGDGFVVAHKGQYVVVAVVDTWTEAGQVLASLDPNLVSTEVTEEG